MPQALRILLVDDERIVRQVVGGMLEKTGYTVERASDGAEALAMMGREHFDVILLDVNMPWVNGRQVAMRVREKAQALGCDPPLLIAVSGDTSQEEDKAEVIWDGWLIKPFGVEEFEEIVMRLREGREGLCIDEAGQRDSAELTSDLPVLDSEKLRSKLFGDQALLERLVKVLQIDRFTHTRRIETALTNAQSEELKDAAHALKGLLANLEGLQARKLAELLQHAAQRKDFAASRILADELFAAMEILMDRLLVFNL